MMIKMKQKVAESVKKIFVIESEKSTGEIEDLSKNHRIYKFI